MISPPSQASDPSPPPPSSDPRPVIAHVLHRLEIAGAEVLASDLSRRLSDRFRFVFFCLDGVGPLGRTLIHEGFEVFDLYRRPGVDLRVAGRIGQLVRENHVQLLHAHQYTPFFYAALSRGWRSWPRILFTEHGRHYPDPRKLKHILVNRLLLLRKQDRVTAVGEFIARALIRNEGIPARRIEVVPNGIDAAAFESHSPPLSVADQDKTTRDPRGQQVRQELGIRPDQLVVLQVARFHAVKDHGTALRAFGSALQRRMESGSAGQAPPLLLLAGDGELRSDMELLAQDLGIAKYVRFLGVRRDVPALMAAADVFLLSSLSEGLSVTLLEAMAAGLPIVATDVGGNGEAVEHGVTGLLAPRQDHARLAEHLVTLWNDPSLRGRMGEAGRQRQQARFTQQGMHERYLAIYRQMLGQETAQEPGSGGPAG
ncbi:MAG: glycosyltransferase [Phycisphaeraceae bacterium]|nr:glycosyltransferase [Phycisphaeraceae bacterium]